MSIVLQGSTSGSITLQEPAVAGSNTINLPAATGTAVLTGVSGNVDINAAGSNNVTLSTNSTERMRITSAGNVGVGTTSPTGKLHVYGSGEVQTLQRSSGSANNYTLFKTESGADQAYLGFSDAGVNDFAIYNVQNGYVRIATNNTERMRVTSDGNVLVNGTSSADSNAKIQAYSPSGNGAQGWIACLTGGSGGGRANQNVGFMVGQTDCKVYAAWDGSGNPRNSVYVSAQSQGVQLSSGASSWSAISDIRQKDIIEPITDAANKLSNLRAVIGKYKNDEEGKRRSFLIAQDVQAVLPEAVTIEDEGQDTEKLLLSYTDVIPLLVASIQELKSIVDTQAIKIAELEAKLEGTV